MYSHKQILEVFPGADVSLWDNEKSWDIAWEYNGHKVSGFIAEDYSAWYSELSEKFTYEPYFKPAMTLEEQYKQVTTDIDKWDKVFQGE